MDRNPERKGIKSTTAFRTKKSDYPAMLKAVLVAKGDRVPRILDL